MCTPLADTASLKCRRRQLRKSGSVHGVPSIDASISFTGVYFRLRSVRCLAGTREGTPHAIARQSGFASQRQLIDQACSLLNRLVWAIRLLFFEELEIGLEPEDPVAFSACDLPQETKLLEALN
jgi:hypothetical protein